MIWHFEVLPSPVRQGRVKLPVHILYKAPIPWTDLAGSGRALAYFLHPQPSTAFCYKILLHIRFVIIVPDLLKWKKINLGKIVSNFMNESSSRRFTTLPFMWQEERNCPCWPEHLISSVAQLFSVALLKILLCPVLVELWCFIYAFTVIPVSCRDDIALGRACWSSLDEGADCTVCCHSGLLLESTPKQKGHGKSGGRYMIHMFICFVFFLQYE